MRSKNWFTQLLNGISALFAGIFMLDFLSDFTGASEEDIAILGAMQSRNHDESNYEDEEMDEYGYDDGFQGYPDDPY